MIYPVSFEGYHSILKSYWKKGLLPTVQKGIYGGILTPENLSLEHLKPHSQGGVTCLKNLALATMELNAKRGSEEITKHLTKEMAEEYLNQFVGVRVKKLNGDKYIELVKKTLKGLNLDIMG